jgi:hypothetical protein
MVLMPFAMFPLLKNSQTSGAPAACLRVWKCLVLMGEDIIVLVKASRGRPNGDAGVRMMRVTTIRCTEVRVSVRLSPAGVLGSSCASRGGVLV